ncbi:hypothetical protein [Nonomuraea sp. NPDC049709]|uniref:hypothetical protein n=1 Tax=Nonomuraea sp. NPDC049709 TaxID=3154736 RepID=UPI00341DA482
MARASLADAGSARLDEDEHLVVPPLSAEGVPAEAKALKDGLAAMLPFADETGGRVIARVRRQPAGKGPS